MSEPNDAVSIYAECGEFAMHARAWRFIRGLAVSYGWHPLGTAPPDELAVENEIWHGEPSDWDGRYFPAYGQNVTETDARELAAALERALPDIPDHDAVKSAEGDSIDWNWFAKARDVSNPLAVFSGLNRQTLRDFIEHCREKNGLWLY